jgi:hypothetical protein
LKRTININYRVKIHKYLIINLDDICTSEYSKENETEYLEKYYLLNTFNLPIPDDWEVGTNRMGYDLDILSVGDISDDALKINYKNTYIDGYCLCCEMCYYGMLWSDTSTKYLNMNIKKNFNKKIQKKNNYKYYLNDDTLDSRWILPLPLDCKPPNHYYH